MEPIIYDTDKRDEFTILILDSDTDVVRKAISVFSGGRTKIITKYGTADFLLDKEESFNDADRLGRWSGKIPKNLLSSDKNKEWTLSFDSGNPKDSRNLF